MDKIGNARRSVERTFRMVPDALFTHPELIPQDVTTWCYLALYARDRGHCQPTDRGLAEAMGVVPMTVQRSLSRLERHGFILRERIGMDRTIVLIPEGDGTAPGLKLRLVNDRPGLSDPGQAQSA